MSIEVNRLCGKNGVIIQLILNQPKSLNALTTNMIEQLLECLDLYEKDETVKAIWLEGAGDKAFCAGGDVVMLYHSMKNTAANAIPEEAAEFFTKEYSLDYKLHQYAKPVIVWADGIVMGGGLGIAVAGSHRIVTERSMIAMPEVTIGLYPDVGASWFFQRMPGKVAEFLGMTGARMNAADALFSKLADHFICSENKQAVLDELLSLPFLKTHQEVTNVISKLEQGKLLPESNLRKHFDLINALHSNPILSEIVQQYESADFQDKWLQRARATLNKGCPMTLALVQEQIERGKYLSLKEVFQMELIVSVNCAMHNDLSEGIRALLIDKDGQPDWSLKHVDEILPEHRKQFFMPPWQGKHPLIDIE